MKNSLARIAPSVTARRLVDDSLSPNTSRACAGALGRLDA